MATTEITLLSDSTTAGSTDVMVSSVFAGADNHANLVVCNTASFASANNAVNAIRRITLNELAWSTTGGFITLAWESGPAIGRYSGTGKLILTQEFSPLRPPQGISNGGNIVMTTTGMTTASAITMLFGLKKNEGFSPNQTTSFS